MNNDPESIFGPGGFEKRDRDFDDEQVRVMLFLQRYYLFQVYGVTDGGSVFSDELLPIPEPLIVLSHESAVEMLGRIEEALERYRSGFYGVCLNSKCRENIPMARLKVLPFAEYCFPCQRDLEQGKM